MFIVEYAAAVSVKQIELKLDLFEETRHTLKKNDNKSSMCYEFFKIKYKKNLFLF